jgi:sterol 24-C-methyltransferase
MSSSSVQRKDGRVESRVDNYTKFWKKDLSNEQEADNANRLDNYTEVVNGELHPPHEAVAPTWRPHIHTAFAHCSHCFSSR